MPPAIVTKNINCKSTLTANVYLPGNVFTQVTEKPFLSNFSKAFHKRQGLLVGILNRPEFSGKKKPLCLTHQAAFLKMCSIPSSLFLRGYL